MFGKKYQVKLEGRAGLSYQEAGRLMNIDSEMLAGDDFDMVVYLDSIRNWDPPHDRDPVTEDDRRRIRENLVRDLKNYRIDWR